MIDDARGQRDAGLIVYYDREIGERAGRELSAQRVAGRGTYLELLQREGRRSVLEIGCGAGRDGAAFAGADFDYTGVDLAPQSVAKCRELGLDAQVASVLACRSRMRCSTPAGR